MAKKVKIAMGADHGGYRLKEVLKGYLKKKGFIVLDFGTFTDESCDYPLIGHKVAKAVATKKCRFGINICKSGFGMGIISNKVKSVRSAVCDSLSQAKSAREHNDCNVLSLSGMRIKLWKAKKICEVFLKTKSLGGRHKRRVKQINNLERK